MLLDCWRILFWMELHLENGFYINLAIYWLIWLLPQKMACSVHLLSLLSLRFGFGNAKFMPLKTRIKKLKFDFLNFI